MLTTTTTTPTPAKPLHERPRQVVSCTGLRVCSFIVQTKNVPHKTTFAVCRVCCVIVFFVCVCLSVALSFQNVLETLAMCTLEFYRVACHAINRLHEKCIHSHTKQRNPTKIVKPSVFVFVWPWKWPKRKVPNAAKWCMLCQQRFCVLRYFARIARILHASTHMIKQITIYSLLARQFSEMCNFAALMRERPIGGGVAKSHVRFDSVRQCDVACFAIVSVCLASGQFIASCAACTIHSTFTHFIVDDILPTF